MVPIKLNGGTRASLEERRVKAHTTPGSGKVCLDLQHVSPENLPSDIFICMVQGIVFLLKQEAAHCGECTRVPEKIKNRFSLEARYPAAQVGSQIIMGKMSSASVPER